jgi:hypothetical protein
MKKCLVDDAMYCNTSDGVYDRFSRHRKWIVEERKRLLTKEARAKAVVIIFVVVNVVVLNDDR